MNNIFEFEIIETRTKTIQIDFEKLFQFIVEDNGHFTELYDVCTDFNMNAYYYLVNYDNGSLNLGTYEESMDPYLESISESFEHWVSENETYLKEKRIIRNEQIFSSISTSK